MTVGEHVRESWSGVKARLYGGPEDCARDRRTEPERIVSALALIGGERVVDLGAGGGYYTLRLARAVGPTGVVYAVDLDPGLLRRIAREAERAGLDNVRPIEADESDARLPEPVDLIFASASYHHIGDRVAYFSSLRRELRPGGRLAIIERRRLGLARLFGHATEPDRMGEELAEAGFRLIQSHGFPAGSSFQVFARDGSHS